MIVHSGFATTIVQDDESWELWSIWCVGSLLGCHRARHDGAAAATRHQDAVVADALTHVDDELARSTKLEMQAAAWASGQPVMMLTDSESACRYFIDGRNEQFIRMSAHALVLQVNEICGAPSSTVTVPEPCDPA